MLPFFHSELALCHQNGLKTASFGFRRRKNCRFLPDSGNFPFAPVETVTVYVAVRWRKWGDISRSLLYGPLVQLGEKKNSFCVRPSWHIMTPYAQTMLPQE